MHMNKRRYFGKKRFFEIKTKNIILTVLICCCLSADATVTKVSGINFTQKGFLSTKLELPSSAGTIELWFKPTKCDNNDKLLSFTKDKKNYASLGFNPTTLIFIVKTAGKAAYGTIPKKRISVGKWHHLAIVYEKSKFKMFLNGRKQSVSSIAGNFDAGSLGMLSMRIGSGPDIREQFNGSVAGVRISAGQRYTSNFTTPLISAEASLACWNFNKEWSKKLLTSSGEKELPLKVEGQVRCGTKIITASGTSAAGISQAPRRPDPPRRVKLSSAKVFVKLLEKKRPLAVIVIPDGDDSTPSYKRSPWVEFQSQSLFEGSSLQNANFLADYIWRSTAIKLPIYYEKDVPTGKTQIHVGATEYAKKLNLLSKLKNDTGFVIKTVNPQRVILLGGSNLGTEYAVYEFLERFLGVRWLFPGEAGICVPASEGLAMPETNMVSEPSFYSREFRVKGREGMLWCRRNRIHSRIEFHHNIPKITSLRYTRSHPEIFPLINGKRRLPKRLNQDNWHLCYADNASAGLIGKDIVKFFKRYPYYESISLGVADGNGECYCHCDSCQAGKGKQLNSFGFADYSDLYYRWVNKVLAKVLKVYPNKKIGTLAYREVLDPPRQTKINPNVFPYITWEAMQWGDQTRREVFKKTFMNWCAKAQHPGLYDYVWTGTYAIPLLYPHIMQEYLQYILNHDAISYYAENKATAKTFLNDGPALYLLARLLWNVNLNVDKATTDWCVSAVGEKAAPYLVKYFKLWENYWSNRVKSTKWYGKKNVMYLMFNQMGYLENVTLEDIERSKKLLKQVIALADEGNQKQRAGLIYKSFAHKYDALRYQVEVREVAKTDFSGAKQKVLLDQDYSNSTQRWKLRRRVPEKPWDAKIGHNSPGSVKVKSFVRGVGDCESVCTLVMWRVKVKHGKKYLLEFYAKADKLPEKAKISIILDWRDKNKNEKPFKSYKLVLRLDPDNLSSDKWTKQQYYFTVPSNKNNPACSFDAWLITRNISGGCYWLDDLKLIEIE